MLWLVRPWVLCVYIVLPRSYSTSGRLVPLSLITRVGMPPLCRRDNGIITRTRAYTYAAYLSVDPLPYRHIGHSTVRWQSGKKSGTEA